MSAEPKFIHINTHSSFSLLEAIPSVKNLAVRAKEYNMPALGIADTNNLFGAMEVCKYLPGEGVQPILGSQVSVLVDGMGDPGLISLLVKNEKGWRNLLKISSIAYLETPDGHDPEISLERLKDYSEGLIALTGNAVEGLAGKVFREKGKGALNQLTQDLESVFTNNLYIELQRHGMEQEIQLEPVLLDVAYNQNIPLVASNDCRFLDKDQAEAFDVMLCIKDSKTLADPQRRSFTPEHYFKTQDEMCEIFKDLPEATQNTVNIAKRCAYTIPTGTMFMPVWDTPEDKSVNDVLKEQAYEGLEERLTTAVYTDEMSAEEKEKIRTEYFARLDYELDVINNMNYPGYFLITSDFIKWSKEQNIPVGPGRGSGAGSLVAWAIKITEVDPIPWGLYFERFLNPDRISPPDFDVDFCQERRDEVIDYVRKKYGDACVSQIITFGTLKARACLRDVGRVLQMPFGQVGQICQFIPEGPASIPIAQALEEDERLEERYNQEDEVKQLLDVAMQLEGAYRHASTHAAGVIIADRNIEDVCALYKDPRSDMPATQFSMFDAEEAGLMKFDFLGLKTLTVIQYCMNFLKEKGIEFDINLVPLDDEPTLQMLRDGHTVGVFQVESTGMTDFLKRIQPDKFQYLSDVIALYRPGPLGSGMADDFIECRHGRQEAKYPHPILEEELKDTFGVPVYQEQVMRMAQVMAGYSLGQADLLRRAMGKKKAEEMRKQRQIFIEGAKEKHNISEEESNKVFDLMEQFASYGFNKAHTIAYAFVAWQTAYLKANYPLEFMAASMCLDRHNTDKLIRFKRDLERMQVPLLPPDINKSDIKFKVENDKAVRFALTAIKGAGEEAMRAIIHERDSNGAYKDIFDFIERQESGTLNKKQMESLICSGAFDTIEPNRAFLMENITTLLGHMQTINEEKKSDQIGLFGEADSGGLARPTLAPHDEWDMFEKLHNEQKVIGFYLSSHPLRAYAKELASQDVESIANLFNLADKGRGMVRIAGIIHGKREMKTKNGNRMAFVTVSDTTGQDEIALFPEAYERYLDLMETGTAVMMTINARIDGERLRLNVETMQNLDECLRHKQLIIRLNKLDKLEDIKAIIDEQPAGDVHCKLHYRVPELGEVKVNLNRTINLPKRTFAQLERFGSIQVQ